MRFEHLHISPHRPLGRRARCVFPANTPLWSTIRRPTDGLGKTIVFIDSGYSVDLEISQFVGKAFSELGYASRS